MEVENPLFVEESSLPFGAIVHFHVSEFVRVVQLVLGSKSRLQPGGWSIEWS